MMRDPRSSLMPTIALPGPSCADGDSVHWRTVMDNMFVEVAASLLINVSAVMYGNLGLHIIDAGGKPVFTEPWGQAVPAIAVGLVMLTCKDEQYYPPDATPTITLLLWLLGAYDSILQVAARMAGQAVAMGLSLWICHEAALLPQAFPVARPVGVVFAFELVATLLEHMAVVYLMLPLLPPNYSSRVHFLFPKVLPKRTRAVPAPGNQAVAHAATAFALSHLCLRVSFQSEMNPVVLIIKAVVAVWQLQRHEPGIPHITEDEIWHELLFGLWGQAVGVALCAAYTVAYVPTVEKYWPAATATSSASSSSVRYHQHSSSDIVMGSKGRPPQPGMQQQQSQQHR